LPSSAYRTPLHASLPYLFKSARSHRPMGLYTPVSCQLHWL